MPGEIPGAGGQPAGSVMWLRAISRLLDDAFRVPGLRWRVGLDPLIGLIPVFGDLATVTMSFYILITAAQMQVPRATLYRMGMNIVIDYVVGSVPLLGNVFDFFWKANSKNMQLLERAMAAAPEQRRRQGLADGVFVAGLFVVLIAVLIGSLTVAMMIAGWIVRSLGVG